MTNGTFPAEKTTILFIGGRGRSGSTLLDLLLAQVEGFVSAGEVHYIWERGFLDNLLCGCGDSFKECQFWAAVVEEGFGRHGNLNVGDIVQLKHSVDRILYIPKMALRHQLQGYRERLVAYMKALSKLYEGIRKVSGKSVIIDSSKSPSHGFILSIMQSVDLQIVHLVRDSRAVAYSDQRRRLRPEVHRRKEYMPQYTPAYSARGWVLFNSLIHVLGVLNRDYFRLRYEDLAIDPGLSIGTLLSRFGHSIQPAELRSSHEIKLGANHGISGNPVRFQSGSMLIEQDMEWQAKMDRGQRLIVTTLTWPLLLKYGYISKRSS